SITNGWPSRFDSWSPTMRAITSDGPPAANGTMIVTWRDGNVSACAPATPSAARSAIDRKNGRGGGRLILVPSAVARGLYQRPRGAREEPAAGNAGDATVSCSSRIFVAFVQ